MPEYPNILWITSEDNGISWVSCYGSTNAKTPFVDALAAEGFRYTHCFDNAAVCAPTRSTWITGMYAVSNGTQPMRSRNNIPHDRIKYYADLLREAGYHTSNPGKTDYNIGGRADKDCWIYKDGKEKYGWRLRKPDQPFFAVVNVFESHESGAHPGHQRKRGRNTSKEPRNDPAKMKLWAYHPDLPIIRQNYALYADAVEAMDRQVGRCIEELKKDGLYEDTIVIYCSDHGGVMPRSKRFLYSSGIHCPMVIRIPEKWKDIWPAKGPGSTVDRLVSFVDMPKTWLSLAGAETPDTLQGTVFLGAGTEEEPRYHFAFRERADERCDCVRVMRDKRYAYHKNYMPYVPNGQYLPYLWRAPAAAAWEKYHMDGKTDEITGRFFRPRPSEEFYDTVEDFDNINNLIDDPKHARKIAELKKAMREEQLRLRDSGLIPESMRERRAAENNVTIYDMVRDEELYPIERYLDAADMALARDPQCLDRLEQAMSDADEAIRYWAIVGLHLLDEDAAPAVEVIVDAMADDCHEVRLMAAWAAVKLGKKEQGLVCLRKLLFDRSTCHRLVVNVIDWMGEPAFPLVKEFAAAGMKRDIAEPIFKHIIEVNGLS